MTFLVLVPLLAAPDLAALAPAPQDLAAAQAALRVDLDQARAAAEATERLQNALAESGALGRKPCSDPADAALIAREAVFGAAWRDAAQTARTDAARLQEILAAPTLAPLLDAGASAEAAALIDAADVLSRRYAEASAWHARHAQPRVARCPGALAPAAGLPRAEAHAPGEVEALTAITGVGGGVVCPTGAPADGRVVYVGASGACTSAAGCGCAPAAVLPGAVLGP